MLSLTYYQNQYGSSYLIQRSQADRLRKNKKPGQNLQHRLRKPNQRKNMAETVRKEMKLELTVGVDSGNGRVGGIKKDDPRHKQNQKTQMETKTQHQTSLGNAVKHLLTALLPRPTVTRLLVDNAHFNRLLLPADIERLARENLSGHSQLKSRFVDTFF
jgi:hypothetical protein